MKATTVSFIDGRFRFIVPSGRYYVVDPCYIFQGDNDLWDSLCAYSFPEGMPMRQSFVMHIDGYDVWVGSTAFGDGTFSVRTSKDVGIVGVDAGCLSLVPVELADKWGDDGKTLGHLVEVRCPVDLEYSKGNWSVGVDCEVITDGSDRSDDDCCDKDDYDDDYYDCEYDR